LICVPGSELGGDVDPAGGFFSFGRGSEATKRSAPTAGERNIEQKKYPQKPNFLFLPRVAIRRESAK